MKILFVASEGLPFSKTGGLADVLEALPKALALMGHEVAVVLPRYRDTKVSAVVLPSLTIPLNGGLRFPAVADGSTVAGVRYYFVDDPEYFDRDQLYAAQGKDYPDNGERFGEFCKAAVEISKHVWPADVIHCHDWQTALVPVLLHTLYASDPLLQGVPVVFTVHNMGYHGLFSREILTRLGLPESLFHMDALEFYGKVNYLKGGLLFADYLTTVSRKYAQEIQTAEYGHGLEGVIRGRADRLRGILNGVDYSAWSPEEDTFIAAQYSARDLSGKRVCKKDLLEQFRLPGAELSRPLIGIVSRFADQKGFDLIAQVAQELLRTDLTIVALGTGDPKYEALFRDLAARFPDKIGLKIGFDNALAHKIEAGADMFLMPSRYEPCGLNQIYSLRYGTIPVVRATGGLDDTIEPFDPRSGVGTGFRFEAYDGRALLTCLRQALTVYGDAAAWRKVQANGMAKDFSWNVSAAEYVRLYDTARKARIPRAADSSNQFWAEALVPSSRN
ncbi:MAG TPA: glycogen synthase GlgA [Candidatus Acidoferrales bacterium]|nr:glycogen synthase GlgA [Candidatus Acidoferrales bacterium]